jgi:hypothetical protein
VSNSSNLPDEGEATIGGVRPPRGRRVLAGRRSEPVTRSPRRALWKNTGVARERRRNPLLARMLATRTTFVKIAALIALGLCGACSSTSSAAPAAAVLTGVATPCIGATTHIGRMEVRVTLSADSKIVASQAVTGSHTYRFRVAPGQYRVSSDQQYVSPVRVTLHSGQTTTIDLDPNCK